MGKNHWDAIMASTPVNKLAATVASGGESYIPTTNTSAMFWDERPTLLNLKEMKAAQPQFIDLTGTNIGRMIVVGIYADDPPSSAKKTKGSLWVCRCVCGRYQGVRAKRIKDRRRDRCDYCYHTDDLRQGRVYDKKDAAEKTNLGKLDIHFQSQFQETPSGVKVSSTLLRKLRGIDISEDHNLDAGEDR